MSTAAQHENEYNRRNTDPSPGIDHLQRERTVSRLPQQQSRKGNHPYQPPPPSMPTWFYPSLPVQPPPPYFDDFAVMPRLYSSNHGSSKPAAEDNRSDETKTTTRGPPPPVPTTAGDISLLPELRDRMRGYVDDIIRSDSQIPRPDAAAYLEATAVDAELVRTESDPVTFVRFCKYDLWAGAKRLCVYWTERLKLFGRDRAFLPMTLTGTGALSDEDLLTLHAGWPALIPETATRPKTVLFDRRKWIPDDDSSIENKLRCLFYVFHVAAADPRAQVDGILMLVALMTPRFAAINIPLAHRGLYLGANVFPVRTESHIINIVPRRQRKSILADTLTLVNNLAALYRKSDADPIHIHTQKGVGEKPENGVLMNKLLKAGLTKKEIPLMFGGEWKYDDFSRWCRERKVEEEVKYRGRLLSVKKGSNSVAAAVAATSEGEGQIRDTSRTSSSPALIDGEPQDGRSSSRAVKNAEILAQKRRIADIVHSRRKRERKQKEEIHLKEEFIKLTNERQSLLTEQTRLKALIEQAHEMERSLRKKKRKTSYQEVPPHQLSPDKVRR